MPANERLIAEVVRGWIEKAENDLKNAALTLQAGQEAPTDTVAFHAQQCVEKYLKALLTLRGIDFPKIHDIGELVARVGSDVTVSLSVEEQRRLTAYNGHAVSGRLRTGLARRSSPRGSHGAPCS